MKTVNISWDVKGFKHFAKVPLKALDRFTLLYCIYNQMSRDIEAKEGMPPLRYENSNWFKKGIIGVKPVRKLNKACKKK